MNLADYLPEVRINDEWAKLVCRIGQGHECCRYLTVAASRETGWSCEKYGIAKAHLDRRAARGEMTARGDNCGGRKSL